MTLVKVGLAIAVVVAMQTTVGYLLGASAVVNLVLVVVIFASLLLGPVWGLFTGSAAGLAQDALSGGVLGVGGFASSVVGFLCGVAGSQFIVTNFATRLVVFVLGSIVYSGCYLGLYRLIEPKVLPTSPVPVFVQTAVNGVLGAVAFQLVEWWPDAMRRRRLRMGVRR
ncbi:MAG: rod shape-determining protein MreD [Vicinamibacterales bacterium]